MCRHVHLNTRCSFQNNIYMLSCLISGTCVCIFVYKYILGRKGHGPFYKVYWYRVPGPCQIAFSTRAVRVHWPSWWPNRVHWTFIRPAQDCVLKDSVLKRSQHTASNSKHSLSKQSFCHDIALVVVFVVSDASLDPHDCVKRSALDPGEPVAAYPTAGRISST